MMTKKKTATKTTLTKPTLAPHQVLGFAEAQKSPRSSFPPAGDTRLAVNLRLDLHYRLRLAALKQRTTVRALIESWIEKYCPAE